MAAGRPQLNYGELVPKAEAYVAGEWANEQLPGGFKIVYPMVQNLAWHLGISKETLYARAEFSDVLSKLKELQENLLANNGLSGTTNPLITKMLLSAKHGYVEKTAAANENLNTNLNQDVSDLDEDAIKAKLAALRQSQGA